MPPLTSGGMGGYQEFQGVTRFALVPFHANKLAEKNTVIELKQKYNTGVGWTGGEQGVRIV